MQDEFYDSPYGDINPFDELEQQVPVVNDPEVRHEEAEAKYRAANTPDLQSPLYPEQQQAMKQDLDMLTFLQGLVDSKAVEEEERRIGMTSPLRKAEANPLPVIQAEGMTEINPMEMQMVMPVLSQSFPSMTPTAMLMDPNDRIFYVMSIMQNPELRSDLKAPLIDSVMRTGKFTPNALGKDWYALRGIELGKNTMPGMGMGM